MRNKRSYSRTILIGLLIGMMTILAGCKSEARLITKLYITNHPDGRGIMKVYECENGDIDFCSKGVVCCGKKPVGEW